VAQHIPDDAKRKRVGADYEEWETVPFLIAAGPVELRKT